MGVVVPMGYPVRAPWRTRITPEEVGVCDRGTPKSPLDASVVTRLRLGGTEVVVPMCLMTQTR